MKHQSLVWAGIGIALLGMLAAWYCPRVDQFSDIFFYEKISSDVASVRGGSAPGEASAWYPPFAAAVFYGIGRIPSLSFVQSWLVFVVCATAAATAYIYFVLREKRAYLLLLAIMLCFFLLGNNVTFARYDVAIGLCIVLGYLAYRAKHYASSIVFIILVAGLVLIYWRIAKRAVHGDMDIALVFAACISWTLFIAPVFSPQFLLWLIPLMLVWIGIHVNKLNIPSQTLLFAFLPVFICIATQWIYPWHYREFFEQTYMFNIVVLCARNIAVGILAWFCLQRLGIPIRIPFAPLRAKIATFFTQETAPLTQVQKKIASYIMVAIAIGSIGYVCSFKILDRDFWWHIKAGEVMWNTGELVKIEPFAYTREGKPYLATQSWLAEVALYGIHNVGGTNGIILFRTIAMLVVFGLLLAINKKHIWLTSLLVLFAANAAQPAFIERPQLFTFALFALFVFLALRVLEKGLSNKLALALIILEILWVNMHGAAAFLGIFIVVCLALQRAYTQRQKFTWKPWAYLGGGMVLAFFASPSGYHNITYMFQLLSDKTIIFIEEWQPRPLALYLGEMGLLWIAAIWSLWSTKRNWVFCTALLVGVGFLSVRALRHEVLFVIAAVGVTIYQLRYSKGFERFAQYLARRQVLAGLILLVSLFSLFQYTKNHYQNFAQQDQLFGYGAFTPAKGAYEFIEKHNLQGNMFNTYGIGGYLLNRGYPERKVYIDGRNVDYGFEFMNATYEAGLDAEGWKKVEDKHNLTYAIIDYMAIAKVGRAGFSVHLDKNPDWKLVYLDDWTGVYVKDIPQNQDVIRASTYTALNPINVEKGAVMDSVTAENAEAIKKELQRMIDGNPDGVQGRLLLARIYISDGSVENARTLLEEVKRIQPHHADAYQLLGTIALTEQQWVEAADYYTDMLARTGKAYPNINYHAIADIFAKAGHPIRAAWYRFLAQPTIDPQMFAATPGVDAKTPGVESGSGPISQETIGDLFAGIAQDLQTNNDEGVALAQQGKFPEAKEKFMEALKLDPGNPQTLNNLGALSMQMGDEAASLDYLKRALERTDEYPDAHYNLAIIYYRQQKYSDALQEAEKAQKYGRDSKSLIEAIRAKLK